MTALRQEDILSAVWRACDTFRGAVDATQYKDYVSTALFLKYISDVRRKHVEEFRREYRGDEVRIQRRLDRERFKVPTVELKNAKNNIVEESFLGDFYSLYERRARDNIGELINIVLDAIEKANEGKLGGLFRAIDFNSETNLGQTKDRNRRLKTLLEDFAKPGLDLGDTSEDILGDAYIFLIERFASDAGKKAGEFFTPRKVSEVVAKLAHPKSGDRICDPACGSGSLLLRAGDEVGDGNFQLFGQDSNGQTRSLARLNMLLAQAGWRPDRLVRHAQFAHPDRKRSSDEVRCRCRQSPFSLDKWWDEETKTDPYKRFTPHMPPKSRGDYGSSSICSRSRGLQRAAWLLWLRMACCSGQGRKGKSARSSSATICSMRWSVFPRSSFRRPGSQSASWYSTKHARRVAYGRMSATSSSSMRAVTSSRQEAEPVAGCRCGKIIDTYRLRTELARYSHKATFEEIQANGFNLNIPRYVDTFEPEPAVDLQAVQNEIRDLESQLAQDARKDEFLSEGAGHQCLRLFPERPAVAAEH